MCFLSERSTLQRRCTWRSVNIRVCVDAYLNSRDGSMEAYQRSVILESLLLFHLFFINRKKAVQTTADKEISKILFIAVVF